MRFNLLSNSRQLLTMAAAALVPLAAAHATDLYDSLKAWDKQAAEEQKYRESSRAATPSLQPEPTATGNSGARGPIRSDMPDDRPAVQQTNPPSDEADRRQAAPPSDETGGQQPLNSPRTPSP